MGLNNLMTTSGTRITTQPLSALEPDPGAPAGRRKVPGWWGRGAAGAGEVALLPALDCRCLSGGTVQSLTRQLKTAALPAAFGSPRGSVYLPACCTTCTASQMCAAAEAVPWEQQSRKSFALEGSVSSWGMAGGTFGKGSIARCGRCFGGLDGLIELINITLL